MALAEMSCPTWQFAQKIAGAELVATIGRELRVRQGAGETVRPEVRWILEPVPPAASPTTVAGGMSKTEPAIGYSKISAILSIVDVDAGATATKRCSRRRPIRACKAPGAPCKKTVAIRSGSLRSR